MGTSAARLGDPAWRFRPVSGVNAVLCCALCFGSSLGCARELPGPEECQRVALRVLGVKDRALLEVPKVRDAVVDETVRCLTTPYDPLFVRCIEERGASRRCSVEFEARKRAAAP